MWVISTNLLKLEFLITLFRNLVCSKASSDFQHGFRSFRSTANLPRIISDRIVRVFNKSRSSRAAVLNIIQGFQQGLT